LSTARRNGSFPHEWHSRHRYPLSFLGLRPEACRPPGQPPRHTPALPTRYWNPHTVLSVLAPEARSAGLRWMRRAGGGRSGRLAQPHGVLWRGVTLGEKVSLHQESSGEGKE